MDLTMNILATPNDHAVARLVNGNRTGWWNDKGLLKLARRTAFRDTNEEEFDQAVAFCREKNLSPLSGQLFAFVFSKDDPKKRNMVIVTSIMGYRAIANRSGDYMPGPARAHFEPGAKDPLRNPRGLVRATAAADRFIHGGWRSVEEEALWESFAPIIKSAAEEDYEWVDTGDTWPDTGKPKKKKRLRQGAEAQAVLDPKKDGWHRMPDVMLKKCGEAAALRRGWPEDLSGLYVEEEMHRSQVIDASYTDLTPSEIIDKITAEDRLARIGGPALFATFDHSGTLERVAIGQFADRMLAATAKLAPAAVAALVGRNREALREFWGHNKTDALQLRQILEARSAAAAPPGERAPAKEAPSQLRERETDGAASQTRGIS
jgi:phage recombination protein Bet